MNASLKKILILFFFSILTFSISNYLLNGSVGDEFYLAGELKTPPDSLYRWSIGKEAPFKYRMLHRVVVEGTYSALKQHSDDNDLFFHVYAAYAFFFQTFAIFLFYYFLIKIDLEHYALMGAIIFSLLPAFLLAYNLPVHTREDMMAYSLLLLGLISIVDNRLAPLFIISVLGVLCRETLLIIPFVNLFFNRKQHLAWRLAVAFTAGMTLIGLRFWYGLEHYDFLEGFKWNINNVIQVIGFSYITFGPLWFPFLLSFFLRKNKYESKPIGLIYQSSVSVLFLVFVTTFIGAIFNEIRILYLLAPWVIAVGVHYYSIHKKEFTRLMQSRRYRFFAGAGLVVTILLCYSLSNLMDRIQPSHSVVSYTTWVIVAVIQMFLGFLCMPMIMPIQRKKDKLPKYSDS